MPGKVAPCPGLLSVTLSIVAFLFFTYSFIGVGMRKKDTGQHFWHGRIPYIAADAMVEFNFPNAFSDFPLLIRIGSRPPVSTPRW